jgi:uncharacterized membrane protein YebE (DUF533 family)
MSLKSMVAKLAIAYVAAKGAQAFTQNGGMDGVKRKLAEQKSSGQGIGGMLSGAGSPGGLGGILGQLGLGGAGGSTSAGLGGLLGGGAAAGGIGGMLGGLAGSQGPAGSAQKMQGLLDSTAVSDIPEEAEAGLVIRAMVMAAKADGEIDETERRALWEVLGDSDPSDRAFVEAALSAPVDPETLAADVPKGMEIEVYTASVMAITPDNRDEAQYLDRLARLMGLDKKTVNDLHTAQGKSPLYSL